MSDYTMTCKLEHDDDLIDREEGEPYITHDGKEAAAHIRAHRAIKSGPGHLARGVGTLGGKPDTGLANITQHKSPITGRPEVAKLPKRGGPITADEKALLGAEVALDEGPTWSVWCHIETGSWALTQGGHDDWEYRTSYYIRQHMVTDRAGQPPLWAIA